MLMARFAPAILVAAALYGQAGGTLNSRPPAAPYGAPNMAELTEAKSDSLELAIERYTTDLGNLRRFYNIEFSSNRHRVLSEFHRAWLHATDGIAADPLGPEAKLDLALFRNHLNRELRALEAEKARLEELNNIVPFAQEVAGLAEARQRVDPLDPAKTATALTSLSQRIDALASKLKEKKELPAGAERSKGLRATVLLGDLTPILKEWFAFYDGYDPLFSWWVGEPYRKLNSTLDAYRELVRERLAGLKKDDRDTILGDPIGRDRLIAELAGEMIAYTPEEIVAIAKKEMEWCRTEMLKASRDLGYGEDWRGALEHVKTLHADPGKQTALIIGLAEEAIEFVQRRDLVTVPQLARDTWRMEMMTPARQRVNPFFTGGEVISVSFPTNTMTQEEKLMSMRGNNIYFSRATVHHELIPGHHLQMFMMQRYRPYRRVFRTPFWMEGWALHWEMLLWELGFPRTPEDRVGMLFWRMHRCARIIFSLSFHLGQMSAKECVDYLVEQVGHERENAAAEVRRSFETDYPPLYQSAYMLGALQFRALHREFVGSGRMTNREFHDRILRGNSMPVELVRARLAGQTVERDYKSNWRFYGEIQ